jgi:NAD(P)-dependent dehydrogenase (short-subunit alcohol dehydrogenase family)
LKRVVITGGASGIGRELAVRYARAGAAVLSLDFDEKAIGRLKGEDNASQLTITHERVDVTDEPVFRESAERFAERNRGIDLFINNAGIGGTLPFADATYRHWEKIVKLNLWGTIHGTTIAFGIMKGQGYGTIANVSSIAGLVPFSGQVLYNTTKFGVTGLTLSLAREAGRHGIKVCIICPGMVKTAIFFKPILGQNAAYDEKRVPPDAVPVERAVKIIMKGLDKNRKIIVFPFSMKLAFFLHRLRPGLGL